MPRNLAMDFLQGASNAVASNVSGPIDLLAAALRKAGFPVPEDPVLSAKWMADRGITVQPQNRVAGMLGETAGLVAPIAAAAKAPQIAAGMLQAGQNLAAPRTLNPQTGAIVYHGSPHKFDRFDSSKIGTGEGVQAYGHGLYLAESPDVAKSYATALAEQRPTLGGKPFDEAIASSGLSQEAKKLIEGSIRNAGTLDSGIGHIWNWHHRGDKTATEAYQFLRTNYPKPSEAGLYKVDLPDEQIARMLDWDKPLSQQAPEARAAIMADNNIREAMRRGFASETGVQPATFGQAYQQLAGRGSAKDMIQRLRAAGAPGIRYLDGGSRGAGTGTSNFVVFPGEEGTLKILERNGQRLSDLGKK
jgi:hypothetical protein